MLSAALKSALLIAVSIAVARWVMGEMKRMQSAMKPVRVKADNAPSPLEQDPTTGVYRPRYR